VINWIDFENQTFNTSFRELIQAIELDREHARQHTILQQKVTEWLENDKDPNFLLNATTYKQAKQWQDQAKASQKKPPITAVQEKFIQQSRQLLLPNNAGFWRRCIAALFDSFILTIGISLIGYALIGEKILENENVLLDVISFIIWWPYCTLLESSSWQATLGKRMMKIRVTDMQGEKIGFGQANARFWYKGLVFGVFMIPFTKKKQGLHDLIANTMVIHDVS